MAEKRAVAKTGVRSRRGATPTSERASYHGHEIHIPADDPGRRVVIDGVPIRYGQAADGYYLSAYAYDRAPSLLEVVKRFVDYRDTAIERREKGDGRS